MPTQPWNRWGVGPHLCVGLDPDFDRLPQAVQGGAQPLLAFCQNIARATAPYARAFKPQFAHFAGQDRLVELRGLCTFLKAEFPEHLLILDVKRGDIGSTAAYYAREAFDVYQADAVTLSPYLGDDALEPFLCHTERLCFVLCRTSNPSSAALQGLQSAGQPLFVHVAQRAHSHWNAHGNVGLVAGATHAQDLHTIRATAPGLPLLVPGVGAQGGDIAQLHRVAAQGTGPLFVNSSRGILYAGPGDDYAEAAARAASGLARELKGAAEGPAAAQ